MCLILDANKYSDFLDLGNEDMEPVRNWIKNRNRLSVKSYSLETTALSWRMDNAGAVKIADVFGNDTMKVIEVKV